FAGHYAAVRLVPIKDKLFIQILADDVQVDGDFASVIERQCVNRRLLRLPTRGGQTVSGGVNAGPRSLAPEVTDVKSELPFGRRIISAIEIIRHPECVDEPLFQRKIGKRLEACDLGGKIRERLGWRGGFSFGQVSHPGGRPQQNRKHGPKTRSGLHLSTFAVETACASSGSHPSILRIFVIKP